MQCPCFLRGFVWQGTQYGFIQSDAVDFFENTGHRNNRAGENRNGCTFSEFYTGVRAKTVKHCGNATAQILLNFSRYVKFGTSLLCQNKAKRIRFGIYHFTGIFTESLSYTAVNFRKQINIFHIISPYNLSELLSLWKSRTLQVFLSQYKSTANRHL